MSFKTSLKPFGMKANRLPVQFSIIVPSTKNNVERKDLFPKRVKQEKEYLTKLFGGETAIEGRGGYVQTKPNKDIKTFEKVMVVEASTTPKTFAESRGKLMKHIQKKQKEWGQDTIFFKIEGESFIYPKRKYIDSDREREGKRVLIT